MRRLSWITGVAGPNLITRALNRDFLWLEAEEKGSREGRQTRRRRRGVRFQVCEGVDVLQLVLQCRSQCAGTGQRPVGEPVKK